MGKYRRMTLAVRCQIDAYLQVGYSKTQIAEKLGFHKSSISRELKRNFYFQTYDPARADELARARYSACRKNYKLRDDLALFVVDTLKFGWSPEQISGRLWLEKSNRVSHECIYQFIKRHPDLKSFLRRISRRSGSRQKQKKAIENIGKNIQLRPASANERRRIGDWERDGMYGLGRKQLLVCTDRKSRFTVIKKPEDGTSKAFAESTVEALQSVGRKVYTVTNDNGSEFRKTKLPYQTYHCDPMKPQQRGTVENAIGLIRQWLNRKTDLDKLTEDDLRKIQDRLNFRPRKCLNYRTPFEVIYNLKVALVY